MNTKIFYFTGTGNSKRIADVMKEAFAAAGHSTAVFDLTKSDIETIDADVVGFVYPVYGLDIPRFVRKKLEGIRQLKADAKVFLIVNGGSPDNVGWSLATARKTLEKISANVVVSEMVQMPNNYTPFDETPEKTEMELILKNGESKAGEIVSKILAGEKIEHPLNLKMFGAFRSKMIRFAFVGMGMKRMWKFFTTTSDCNQCGLCIKQCPMQSIAMVKEKPKWSKSCEQCMRCFNLCPKHAIRQLEFIGKGSTRARYKEPHYHPNKD